MNRHIKYYSERIDKSYTLIVFQDGIDISQDNLKGEKMILFLNQNENGLWDYELCAINSCYENSHKETVMNLLKKDDSYCSIQ